MREIIAKKEKMSEVLLVALALLSLPGSIVMAQHPMAAVKIMAIIGIVAVSFAALVFGIMLFDMRPAIERVGDTLVIIPGCKKISLAIKDITSVRIEEFPPSGSKSGKNKKYQLVISAVVDGENRAYEMAGIHRVEDAFVRLNNLLQENEK